MSAWMFAFLGLGAGGAQIGLIARSARRGMHAVDPFARLFLSGVVLFLSARAGHLAPGVGGWLLGFAGSGLWIARRLR